VKSLFQRKIYLKKGVVMKKLVCLLVLTLFISGCATSIRNLKMDYVPDKASGNSIVIGKVHCKDFVNVRSSFSLHLTKIENDEKCSIHINESAFLEGAFSANKEASAHFFVELSPGTYKVRSIEANNWITWPSVYINVPTKDSVIYVGTIQLVQAEKTNFWTGKMSINVDIIDEREEATQNFRTKYPHLTGDIEVVLAEIK